MVQDSSLKNIKFVLLFSGCIFLGMSLGTALTMFATFSMQNVTAWYVSVTAQAINHLCIYLIPALAYWYLFEPGKWKDFQIRPIRSVSALWAGLSIGIIFLPFIEILIDWNKRIQLPQIFSGIEQWMRKKEDLNHLLTEQFTNFISVDQLILAILVSGIIGSVGEEVFFRGIIQTKLIKGTKNVHVGVWLAAILFSAIHLQFYGFFPRLIMGVLFGYLYAWSGNLWVAIIAHFFNNTLFVLSAYFEHQLINKGIEVKFVINPWLSAGCSLILSTFLLIYFYKKNRKAPSAEL